MGRMRRLADLRNATARIVHQTKNPLQSILLHADLLKDPRAAASQESRDEICQAIVTEAQRLTALLDEMTVFASGAGAALSLERIAPGELLREMAREMAARGGAKLVVEGDLEETVLADPYHLRQAFASVLANAREATANQDQPKIVARLAKRVRFVEVTVADVGGGIPPDRLARVFDPYVSWTGRGVGLGLATAREIIERHRGRIEMRSETGTGTRVRILLPRAPALD